MTDAESFERGWQDKFSRSLEASAGAHVRLAVMAGSESLGEGCSPAEVVAWTQAALERLDRLVPEPQRRQVMTACACHYPRADLQEMQAAYAANHDLAQAHAMLQAQFETFLHQVLSLDEAQAGEIIGRGWGAAGVLQGNTILATKIPRSGSLRQYFQETDPKKRRALYCHCPRIRSALESGAALSLTYCYCGAGFYQDIWQEITRQPVEVEVVQSVLQGADVCQFLLRISPEE